MSARARSHRRVVEISLAVVALLGMSVPAAVARTSPPTAAGPAAPAGLFDPPFNVNATDDTDDGSCDISHCSLREAIDAANANPGPDRITISDSTTIAIANDLPAIVQDLTIEVTSFGCCGPALAYLDGPGSGTGLDLTTGITRIDGLVVGDFATGIRIRAGAAGSEIVNGGTGFGQFGSSPNTGDGMVVEASDVRIEPTPFSSDGVKVVNSGGAGIVVTGTAERVYITRVEVHDNGGLGIDIDPTGVNANDDDDADSGPNGLQNSPVITSVETLGTNTNVEGTLEGIPNTVYAIELFSTASCDSSGFGEGTSTSSGTSIVTDFAGEATFSTGLGFFAINPTDGITATATAPDGSTSEFSNCMPNTVIQRSDLNLAFDDEAELVGSGEPVRYTATVRNDGPTDATGVTFQQVLPAGATFGRATSSKGSCSEAAGAVTCSIGSLPFSFGNTATITVDVLLNTVGSALTSASVSANEPDPDAADNAVNESTTVVAPAPATYTVNSPDDANDGTCNAAHCSLREAILAANGNPGRDTIAFQLTGSQLIQPSSPGLPIVTGPVVIDATTDADFAGSPVVVLAGTNAFGYYGLRIAGGNSEIRGLVLNTWYNPAIDLERWGNDVVAGNWLGLDATGTVRTPNSSSAISVETSNNRVGGTTAADRNVISGSSSGVRVGQSTAIGYQAHDNVIEGNYIGTNATGTAAVFNVTGVVVVDSADTVVGGTAPGAGNVISGNAQDAIVVSDGGTGPHSEDNRIEGNLIGLNAAGTAAVPNQQGISVLLNADRTVIGGTAAGAGNTISGNTFDGILVFSGAPDTLIAGNRIGTDPGGTLAMPNGRHGLNLGSGNIRTTVGGTTPGAANVIAFNGGTGVIVNGSAAILGNSIHSNGGLGIDRVPVGVTPGSAGLTFPTLTSVVTHNATTTVIGTLVSSPSTAFRVELFDNASCDPSGNGEGQTFLASTTVTTNGAGAAGFSVELASPLALGRVVTATATTTGASPLNSEFSACRTNAAPAPESTTSPGAAGTTTTTDSEADGATPADPIETSITVPAGGISGAITIDESTTPGPPPVGYSFFGLQVVISAPTQTAPQPLVFVFTIDESSLPAGATAANTVVLRNDVPVPACTAADASATPDPCVFLRETLAGGDIRLTVRTSAASTWNLGLSTGLPPFPFSGFFSPVDNLPMLNKAKAGSAIPVKFSLGGDRGLAIFAAGYPKSAVTTCDSTAPVDGIEETANPGATVLTYDPATDRYTYVWKTDKAWAGTCRQLVVGLTDGTFHRVNFDFRK